MGRVVEGVVANRGSREYATVVLILSFVDAHGPIVFMDTAIGAQVEVWVVQLSVYVFQWQSSFASVSK